MGSPVDEDLYSGFGHAGALGPAAAASRPLASRPAGFGSPPPGTPGRVSTALRLGTASSELTRPMTSNRGAGFSSAPRGPEQSLEGSMHGPLAGAMAVGVAGRREEPQPEEAARAAEAAATQLMEEGAQLQQQGDVQSALEMAAEACQKVQALERFREKHALEPLGPELAFAVKVQLAGTYAAAGLHQEALDLYQGLVRGKAVPHAGRLRTNMGSIHFRQGRFSAAIKCFRMALDQLPPSCPRPRAALLRNIGVSFVRMGRYTDAAAAWEAAMQAAPNHQCGFNLVVCCHALGDKQGMRDAFARLLQVPGCSLGDGDEAPCSDDSAGADSAAHATSALERLASGSAAGMPYQQEGQQQRSTCHRHLITAAQLVAEKAGPPTPPPTGVPLFVAGYDWVSEQFKAAGHMGLAAEAQLAKAGCYLSSGDVTGAITVFNGFEKRETAVRARAATSLSFLYLLEGRQEEAAAAIDLALAADRYDARAHTNRGVLLLQAGRLHEARAALLQASAIDPLLPEALYNSGLVSLRLGEPQAALAPLRRLHAMAPENVEVLHHLALAADMMGDAPSALRWLDLLSGLVPGDAGVLCKLGACYHTLGEEARSLGYYADAQRAWPANLDVIAWLGAFHVRHEVYERALPLFDLAARLAPRDAKWALMAASCVRRVGDRRHALARYAAIHAAHPTCVEALRFLMALSEEAGDADEAARWADALRRAERMAAAEAASVAGGAAAGTQGRGAVSLQPKPAEAHKADGVRPSIVDDGGPSALDAMLAGRKPGAPLASKLDDWGDGQMGEDLLPM